MVSDEPTEEPVAASTDLGLATQGASGLENLFNEHAGQVFHAALRITGNAEDAEDVLQTVFARLLRRTPLPDLSPSPASYLRRAAINAALDLVRAPRAKDVALDRLAGQQPVDGATRPDEAQHCRELRDALRAALGQMSPRAAEAFVLRHIEGYGNREIAQMIDSTPGAVAVLLHRARHELRDRFRSAIGDGS